MNLENIQFIFGEFLHGYWVRRNKTAVMSLKDENTFKNCNLTSLCRFNNFSCQSYFNCVPHLFQSKNIFKKYRFYMFQSKNIKTIYNTAIFDRRQKFSVYRKFMFKNFIARRAKIIVSKVILWNVNVLILILIFNFIFISRSNKL